MSAGALEIPDEWKSRYPRLFSHMALTAADSPARRSVIQARAIDSLQKFLSFISRTRTDIETAISLLATQDVLNLGVLPYDDKSAIFLVRQIAVLKHKIQKHEIRKLTVQFSVLTDLAESVQSALDFFASEHLPPGVACQVKDTFFEVVYGDSVTRDVHCLTYFCPLLTRLQSQLCEKARALWSTDFPGFFRSLVEYAQQHEIPSEGYFSQFDGEVSLSCALFRPGSPFLSQTDELADHIAAMGGDFFREGTLALLGVPPDEDTHFRSAALLLYFRSVFDRIYDKHAALFAPEFDERLKKLAELADLRADVFVLPRDLFPDDLSKVSIAELFRGHQFYRSAARFFEDALFAGNPIDALFLVNKAMIAVRKAALIHRLGTASASIVDINRVLPFDDLFALLFGTLLASGPPVVDIFFLAGFVEKFTPRQSLSPGLEFAKANLEALRAHIENLDIETLRARALAGPVWREGM